jgi:iron-only hydrogenase group A
MEITIDGKKIQAKEGQTILEAAQDAGIDIPFLCHHPDLDVKANCRLCLVSIKGEAGLHTSCSVLAEEGMEIVSESEEINKARRINLELIFSQHCEECDDCVWNSKCQLLKLASRLGVDKTKFKDRKTNYPVYHFGPALLFDSSKCIDCNNCVEVCHKQGVDFLAVKEKNGFHEVFPESSKKKDCVYCGQCIVHCPAGAFEAIGEFESLKEPYKQKGKILIFQFAPSIRTSIGEEFEIEPGEILTEKLAAGLRMIGADKVFDVSVGADFTTIEEAKELIKRLESRKNTPLFTSCCPAWVKFVEFYHPEFISNLTTAKSPHMMSAVLIKTYWAKKNNINPKDITVVSIMPCVSKKYEIERKENKINGLKIVDYVLTTRELAKIFKKYKIDLRNIRGEVLDYSFGYPSGAGVIYGVSGGVMESALRTACHKICGEMLGRVEFEEVRGMEGIKETEVQLGKERIKIAVVNGLGNAQKIINILKKDPKKYDYVEVMACPGGCIGGGGQPVPSTPKIRKKRAAGLYMADREKEYRLAEDNPEVKDVYNSFLKNDEVIRKICHTSFSKKEKEVYPDNIKNKVKSFRILFPKR